MESFKEFELETPEMILGGDLNKTILATPWTGFIANDLYDTERDRFIILMEN